MKKNSNAVPKGTYHYRTLVGDKLERRKVRAEVIAETAKSYKIRLRGFHDKGYPLGHVMIIKKSNFEHDTEPHY